jgi:hypothetical protein
VNGETGEAEQGDAQQRRILDLELPDGDREQAKLRQQRDVAVQRNAAMQLFRRRLRLAG